MSQAPLKRHVPVLLNECLDLLAPAFGLDSPLMVDATLGLGGHAEGALERFPKLHVIGIDRDPIALELAGKRLARFGTRFTPYHGTYDQFEQALDGRLADGILMDLGVSSMQLDEVGRGFSYANDAPLDMRMNPEEGITAAELLNTTSPAELKRILWENAEERFAPQIARRIVARRDTLPFESTSDLVEVVREAIPAAARRTGGNPAKRTFQAIRIAVNDELGILRNAIPAALENLRVGGRLVVESYQSLEDRIVKAVFAEGAKSDVPPGVPIKAEDVESGVRLRLITRKAIRADEVEQERNARSASVRLRAAELLAPWRTNG